MEEKESSILEDVEKQIELIKNEGVKLENIEYLYKLIDIHKDLKNEEYWKVKEDYYAIQRKLWRI
jgi:hypothetical protein